MKVKMDLGAHSARNIVKLEPDGTIFSYFGATGFLKSVARTRFAKGATASTGSFIVSEAKGGDADTVASAPYALMFVSEVDGVEKLALIERFKTQGDAQLAFSQLTHVLLRRVVRARLGKLWRSAIVWIGAPLLTATVCMAAVRFLDSHNGAIDMLRNLMNTPGGVNLLQPSPADQALGQAMPSIAKLPAAISGQAAAPAADGAVASITIPPTAAVQPPETGSMTSISFGLSAQPPSRVLYVYSDPKCPACRRFEPHLKSLAKDFEIHVLPVAYQEGSLQLARKILCAPDRRAKWGEVMDTLDVNQAVTGAECQQDDAALQANMQTFDRLGFTQTPRVVSGTGHAFAAGATASDIRAEAARLPDTNSKG
ncbi:thioredoxin fold domain-containing protein [Paraburkholderia sp. BR10872]|uniref:thioredoxin fold domain-containing protein n=1 Tax=Paraburkholderia sp. BR10872 TaxID=3236989 RepID=UPI0034D228C8